MVNDVRIFMEACGQNIGKVPGFANEDNGKLYLNLIKEELEELELAYENRNIVETADAIVDLLWVTIGLAHTHGIPLAPVWREVALSNMSKIPSDGRVIRREDGKILKPDTYFPPNIEKVLGL